MIVVKIQGSSATLQEGVWRSKDSELEKRLNEDFSPESKAVVEWLGDAPTLEAEQAAAAVEALGGRIVAAPTGEYPDGDIA